MKVIIAGIQTGIGKTLCSAVICQALGFDYWKPVQAGDFDNTDSMFIKNNVGNPKCVVHPECYKFQKSVSPHFAAESENIEIKKQDFSIPLTKNNLVIETAGGVMSPLSTKFLNIDLIEYLQLPVVLVSNNYLGSINHTLLSYECLKKRKIPVHGLVFSGQESPSSEKFILEYTRLSLLFSIPHLEVINQQSIQQVAANGNINLV